MNNIKKLFSDMLFNQRIIYLIKDTAEYVDVVSYISAPTDIKFKNSYQLTVIETHIRWLYNTTYITQQQNPIHVAVYPEKKEIYFSGNSKMFFENINKYIDTFKTTHLTEDDAKVCYLCQNRDTCKKRIKHLVSNFKCFEYREFVNFTIKQNIPKTIPTYVGIKISNETKEKIIAYLQKNDISNIDHDAYIISTLFNNNKVYFLCEHITRPYTEGFDVYKNTLNIANNIISNKIIREVSQ